MIENYWYMEVEWIHDFPDEPVRYFEEMDTDGWEIRKVVLYCDGKILFADKDRESDEMILSPVPVQSLEEIANDSDFLPRCINKAEFEGIWDQAYRRQVAEVSAVTALEYCLAIACDV